MANGTWTDDDDEMLDTYKNTFEAASTRLHHALAECKRAFMSGWRRAKDRRSQDED